MYTISAKPVKQFPRRCVPNRRTDRQTDRQTNSKLNITHYYGGDNSNRCNLFPVYTAAMATSIATNKHCKTRDQKQYHAGCRVGVVKVNPLMGTWYIILCLATSNNMKLVNWSLMVFCYIWYSEEGTGRGRSPPRALLAVSNVTAHLSTASVPITALLYNGSLFCGFNVSVKG